MFENSVLKRIFGPQREEVTGSRRKLRDYEIHNFYSSRNRPVINVMKPRGMRLSAHVHMGHMRNA
jgi:hypothetical protein